MLRTGSEGEAECPPTSHTINLSCYPLGTLCRLPGLSHSSVFEKTCEIKAKQVPQLCIWLRYISKCMGTVKYSSRQDLFQCIYMAIKYTCAPLVTKCFSRPSQLKFEWFIICNSYLLYYKHSSTLIWPINWSWAQEQTSGLQRGRRGFGASFSSLAEDSGWQNDNKRKWKFLCVACVFSISLISLSSSCVTEHLQELWWHLLWSLFSEWAAPPI